VDDFRTDIKIRGMGNVKLKAQHIRKSTFDHNKLEEQLEKKKIMQKQIAMPAKPATYKKPKPKPKLEDLPIAPDPPLRDPSPFKECIIEQSEHIEKEISPNFSFDDNSTDPFNEPEPIVHNSTSPSQDDR
jgi:hypothetical protein